MQCYREISKPDIHPQPDHVEPRVLVAVENLRLADMHPVRFGADDPASAPRAAVGMADSSVGDRVGL